MRTSVMGLVLAALTGGSLFLGGCASGDGTASASGAQVHEARAMACPKCETVWVADQTTGPQGGTRVSYSEKMACPDCDAAAKAKLTGDGKVMLHDCEMCKMQPQPVKSVERTGGYERQKLH